jgi:glutamyl-tRNA reductase
VRQAEARRAEGIIAEEIQKFAAWLGSLEVLPTIAALRAHATQLAGQVVDENRGKWESASPRDLERVDAVARAVVNRLLHEPTLQMKTMHDDRVHARMAVIRDLFGITVEEGIPAATDSLDEPEGDIAPALAAEAAGAERSEGAEGAEIHELPRVAARGARSRPSR